MATQSRGHGTQSQVIAHPISRRLRQGLRDAARGPKGRGRDRWTQGREKRAEVTAVAAPAAYGACRYRLANLDRARRTDRARIVEKVQTGFFPLQAAEANEVLNCVLWLLNQ